MPTIVRNIQRPNSEVVYGLGEAGVSTVHEAAGRIGLLDPVFRPIQDGVRIAGPAVTVLCAPGDNMMVHAAIEVIQPGDVLVVASTGQGTGGMFGDLLATQVTARGGRGLVIDGGVRDIDDLRRMRFPVWSTVVHAQGVVKETPGSINIPVNVRGLTVNPGDVVVADDDGVVVIPSELALTVLDAANRRTENEAVKREKLAAGEMSLDLDGIRTKLESLGVEWVD